MSRIGCSEEKQKRSDISPGIVDDDETLVFALVYPNTINDQSVAAFQKGKLKTQELSLCRSQYCSYQDMFKNVVEPLLNRDDARQFRGYQWALCREIRAILAQPNIGTEGATIGAFCVFDDACEEYIAHSVMGFAKPPIDKFWEKHSREAARGNLRLVFAERGVKQDHASPPFPEL
jgi:hypothetical protein